MFCVLCRIIRISLIVCSTPVHVAKRWCGTATSRLLPLERETLAEQRGFAATADERLGKTRAATNGQRPASPSRPTHRSVILTSEHVANHGARGFQQYTRTGRAGQEAEEPEASEYVWRCLARNIAQQQHVKIGTCNG